MIGDGKKTQTEATADAVLAIIIIYTIVKQVMVYLNTETTLSCHLWRAVASVVMIAATAALCKYAPRRVLSYMIPIAIAIPEMLWVTIIRGGDEVFYFFLIGCSLLSLMFLSPRGLFIVIFTNTAALFLVSVVLGYRVDSPMVTTRGDFFRFAALCIVNAIIYFICRQATNTIARYQRTGETFDWVLETSPTFLAVINERANVEHITQSMTKWCGISDRQYLDGRAFLDLFRRSGIIPIIQKVIKDGGSAEEVIEIRDGDETYHYMLRSYCIQKGGIARTFEFSDVTAMVEAKKLAEESDRQKSSFLVNMSHEIRTPMNAIVGMSELLLNRPLADEDRDYAVSIKNAAESLLTIINDILDISKLSAGKMVIAATPFNIAALINGVLEIINVNAAKKRLAITVNVSDDVPLVINGDEGRIKQCLLNLMNNAVKFTNEGGKVTLSVSCERLGNSVKLCFKIKDTGIGIKKSEMGKLFETFSQIDTKRNRNIVGTGLGLAITKNLVELMGGEICVESVYGSGTTFSFHIVCDGAHDGELTNQADINTSSVQRRSEGAKLGAIQTTGVRVLLVDDNTTNLAVGKSMLLTYGIEVVTAEDGREGLEKIQEEGEEFDLAFFDHMMPVMDGMEAVKNIRALGGRFETIPIVALTANAVIGAQEMFLQNGFNDFLPKPIDVARLNGILDRWVPENKKLKSLFGDGGYPRNAPPKTDNAETHILKPMVCSPCGNNDYRTSTTTSTTTSFNIEGIDTELGLSRCGGAGAAYVDILAIYSKDMGRKMEDIRRYLEAGDMTGYITVAHGLKSAAANVGAVAVSEAAKLLEAAGRREDRAYIEAHTPVLLADIELLRKRIGEALSAEKETTGEDVEVDRDALGAVLSGLRQALRDFDAAAIKVGADELKKYENAAAVEAKIKTVRWHILNGEYEEAVGTIDELSTPTP